ncbi:MAG TPA: hypothetical protein VFY29_18110 [Terriglobia bacterium]|nr:hypothetical protein [Terriglobia bacterium]
MLGKRMNSIALSLGVLVAFGVYGLAQDSDAIISTVAGTGTPGFSGDGGPATSAELQSPSSLAMDAAGDLFITDSRNGRVRKITPDGTIESVNVGMLGASDMIALDPSGAGFFVTSVSTHSVRKVSASGDSTTVAGTGASGYSGDGGPATAAKLNTPFGLVSDATGNLYIADAFNHRIRKVTPGGMISTIAGTGKPGFGGDGGKAVSAQLNMPASLVIDGSGNLYFSDIGNNCVRKISTEGMISTVAGTGKPGFSGDGLKANKGQLNNPGPLALSKDGSLFISDVLNHRVRKVDSAGIITTVVGNGNSGSGGDGGAALAAQLAIPSGLVVGPVGNLFVADAEGHRVRKISFKE